MSRDLASNTAASYAASHVNPIVFVKLEFDPSSAGTIRLHNGLGTYTWNDGSGNVNWFGTGDLGQIGSIQEGDQISPYNIELTLSGLDAGLVAEAVKEVYYQRPVTLYVGALNDDDQLVATPDVIWNGFIDTMDVRLGGDNGDMLALSAESELAMFERSANLLYTNASQQAKFSGDTFFTHLQEMQDITLDWGKRKGGSGSRVDVDLDDDKIPDKISPF